MKFNNAYDLIRELHKRELLEGIWLGLRGEFELETKIKDSGFDKS